MFRNCDLGAEIFYTKKKREESRNRYSAKRAFYSFGVLEVVGKKKRIFCLKKEINRTLFMAWNPFQIISKKGIGVDVGTSSIKIVELSRFGGKTRLENYGEIKVRSIFRKEFRRAERNILSLSEQDVGKAVKAILEEAGIKTKKAVFSIPDFSSFFTNFVLPSMTEKEIPQAVEFEAKSHIPIPLSGVSLDWQIVEGRSTESKEQKRVPLKVLLVAVPSEVIGQYQRVAEIAGLRLLALEAEVFGLCRALVKEEGGTALLVEIGARSATINIASKGTLKSSHSFDVSGNEFTQVLSKSLGIDYNKAEEMKIEYGLREEKKEIREILSPLIDSILQESERIARDFYRIEGERPERVIFAGAGASIQGLTDYASNYFGGRYKVDLADPFSDIFYPPILENSLKEIGPGYVIATGMALRAIE